MSPPEQPSQQPQEPQEASPPAPAPEPAPQPQAAAREPQAPAPEPQTGELSPDDETWKGRYESQVGRTRRLQQDLQAMSMRLDELQRLLSNVRTPAPEPAAPMTVQQLLTPEEQEEWKEVLPVMEKRFKELQAPVEHQLRAEIDGLKQRMEAQQQSTVATSRAAMMNTLDNHPVLGAQSDYSWRALNENDGFVEWLQYPERLSGRQRHQLLKEAFSSNDAGRVAAIFESYAREAGLIKPAAQANGAGSSPPSNGLERFVAPGPARSAPAAAGASAEPQFFTTGDISRYYADLRLGKWKGREKEAAAYEHAIIAASNAGRVRTGPPQP